MKHNVFILSLLIASVCFLSGCMIRDEVTYYEMDITLPAEGGETTVDIEGDGTYRLESVTIYSEQGESGITDGKWLHFSPEGTTTDYDYNIFTVAADRNDTGQERFARMTLIAQPPTTYYVNITQTAN